MSGKRKSGVVAAKLRAVVAAGLLVLASGLAMPVPGEAAPLSIVSSGNARPAVANDARLAGDRARTRFIADLSKRVDVHVFSLDDPYRVIIDLPDVNFQMPQGIGQQPKGLITGFRYGLFAPGKSRIVLDVSGPFLVDKSFVLESGDGQPARLVVDLVPTDRKTFLHRRDQAADDAVQPPDPLPAPVVRPANAKPVVVIDPGHGGIDPGASSDSGTEEKDVVLAFAKALQQILDKTGKFDVVLTRKDDSFVTLRDRVAFAHNHGASLFLSVHADSYPGHYAARGATVFTLSDEASDNEAKALAAKENLADAMAGLELPVEPDEVVTNILIDLAQRETQNRSVVFAGTITSTLDGQVRLHSEQPKSAGFVVLKSPDVPSVLLELGYLSDPADEKNLKSPKWRQSTAEAVGRAVESYFEQRIARTPF